MKTAETTPMSQGRVPGPDKLQGAVRNGFRLPSLAPKGGRP